MAPQQEDSATDLTIRTPDSQERKSVEEYTSDLQKRLEENGEDFTNSPGLTRWCLRFCNKPLFAAQRGKEQKTDEWVDTRRMLSDLHYCNGILQAMHYDGISSEDAAKVFIWTCLIKRDGLRREIQVAHGMGPPRIVTEKMALHAMCEIQAKPRWQEKIFDVAIVDKWKHESASQGFFDSLWDWLIEALRHKSKRKQAMGGIEQAGPPGVYVCESLVTDRLHATLLQQVDRLANVPDGLKDYHPGTDKMVVDMVHPSMYCLADYRTFLIDPFDTIYSGKKGPPTIQMMRSFLDWYTARSSPSSNAIFLSQEQTFRGTGRVPAHITSTSASDTTEDNDVHSHTYQWLPTDVRVADGGSSVILLSYINNLHPKRHAVLSDALTQLIGAVLPMWNGCLTTLTSPTLERHLHGPGTIADFYAVVDANQAGQEAYYTKTRAQFEDEREEEEANDDDDDWECTHEEWRKAYPFLPPPVGPFTAAPFEIDDEKDIIQLQNQTIQVIFKIASVELTPEKPRYEGGTWHVEGTEREHIISTAIYYLDSDNITTPTLSFRQYFADDYLCYAPYEQDQHDHIHCLYGFDRLCDIREGLPRKESRNVNLGYITTPAGRVVVFPNTMQHKLSPFELIDKSKPGHRTFIVMFLVDPEVRITSTAEVSPQQLNETVVEAAIYDSLYKDRGRAKLPGEVTGEIMLTYMAQPERQFQRFKDGAASIIEAHEAAMTYEEACWHRDKLMDQRRRFNDTVTAEADDQGGWSLCEH